MAKSMEVFRDLNLRGSLARRSDLRQALIAAANDPWCCMISMFDT